MKKNNLKSKALDFWADSGTSPPRKKKEVSENRAYTESPEIVTGSRLEILNTEEAAEYLRVSKGDIYNFVSNGILKNWKIGKRNRFLISDLNKLLVNG